MSTSVTAAGVIVGIVLGVVLYTKVGGFRKLADRTIGSFPIPSV